jgi:hypothetical protein
MLEVCYLSNLRDRITTGGGAVVKLEPKALIQRGKTRLESQQAKISALLDDLHREQQRLEQEAKELEVAERVFTRLNEELEAEFKVLPYNPPSVRRKPHDTEFDVIELGLDAEELVSKLERA